MVDGGELTGGTAGTPTEIAIGTLAFNADGTLQSQATTASSASFVNATPNQAIAFNFGDDIASGGTGLAGTTQFAGSSTVTATRHRRPRGRATSPSVAVGADGTIEGMFDNGDKPRHRAGRARHVREPGRPASAPATACSTQTATSGKPLVDVAGTGARGSISGRARGLATSTSATSWSR